jgi:carbonic anhydrase
MVAARRTGAAFATSLALLSAAAMVPASVLAGEAPSAPEWSYEDPDGPGDWGSLAPEYATCDTGVEQSPVDIPLGAPVLVDHVAFSYVPAPATVVDNGHAIQVGVPDGGTLAVDGSTYGLVQFHFHTPSEHTVAGADWEMELHLVHADEAGALAVVGVPIIEGSENAALAPIWAALPKEVGQPVELDDPLDATLLLPDDLSSVAYRGSLTTPPCSEGVAWHVLIDPIELSAEQIAAYRAIHDDTDRPTEPLGERTFEEP